MQQTWVFNDHGKSFAQDGDALSQHLGTARRGADLIPYLINELGWVTVKRTTRLVTVTFDPRVVSGAALVGAVFWFHDVWTYEGPFVPTRVIDLSDPDVAPVFMKPSQLIAHLNTFHAAPQMPQRYRREDVAIHASEFGTRWKAARDICTTVADGAVQHRLLDALLQGFYAILQFNPVQSDYVVQSMGRAYDLYDPQFSADAIGKTFRFTHDRDYGDWTANCFREQHTRGDAPRVEAVTATIAWPKRKASDFHFQRLMLPISADGSRMLSATHIH